MIVASALAGSISNFIGNGFLPLAPFIIPRPLVGFCLSLASFSSLITLLFVGPTVDRVGSHRVLQYGIMLQAISILLTVVSRAVVCQMLGRVAQGVAGSVVFNSCIAFVMDHFEEPARAKHIGTVLGAFMTGGFVGVPVMSSLYSITEGMPHRLAWAFLPSAMMLPVAYWVLWTTPAASKQNPTLDCALLLNTGACQAKSSGLQLLRVYTAVGRQAFLLGAMLVCSCFACGALQCAGLLEMHAHGMSSAAIGLAFVPNLLLQAVASPWAGHASHSPARRRQLIISSMFVLVVGLSALLALPFEMGTAGVVVASTCTSSVAMALIDAPSISLMTELAVSRGCGHGEAVTASELAVTAGFALGPGLGQLVLRSCSFDGVCCLIVFLAVCLGVLGSTALEEGSPAGNRSGCEPLVQNA